MYQGKRIVAYIPFGRQRTVSILMPYLQREHAIGVLDELMLYENTGKDQESDRAYARDLVAQHDWVNLYLKPGPDTPEIEGLPDRWLQGYRQPVQLNTGRVAWYQQDRNTIYLRFDDDIIWVHPRAIREMVDALIQNEGRVLGVFPIIWNNAISSKFLQQWGHLRGDLGWVRMNAVDPVGWGSPKFAEYVHDILLHHLEHEHPDACIENEIEWLDHRQQFSVSTFAISGNEYADVNGVLDWWTDKEEAEEEHWLTQFRTGVVNRRNLVCGRAQVAHYTFFTQKDYINRRRPDILDRYRAISEKVTAGLDNPAQIGLWRDWVIGESGVPAPVG